MKNRFVKAIGILLVAGLGSGAALAQQEGKVHVVYKGDPSAKGVCMSIVRDDLAGLRAAFRHGRRQLLERSYLVYECNDMPLDEFAFNQNAMEVSDYLAPKFGREGHVTIEQVSSIDD